MSGRRGDEPDRAIEDPGAQLEQAFIAEFLERMGHSLESLHHLPADEAAVLLKQASQYASGRLTEVESRAHLVHDLHHVKDPQSD
jgi:hypothetical protein